MKYKSEEKTKILEEYKQSNLSVTAFCKNKKLTANTLKSWLNNEKPTFLKAVAPKIVQKFEKSNEIRIECGVLKIFVTPNVDESLLCSVLASAVKVC